MSACGTSSRPTSTARRKSARKKGKPAPDVFLHACKELGVEPNRAVVIEDSVHGVTAAAAAGCRVVGFTGGRHSYPGHADALTEAGAETVISRLARLPGRDRGLRRLAGGLSGSAQRQATSSAPARMRPTPSQLAGESFSPSSTTPKTATRTTLSLSIGATSEAGPSFSARK